jgi:hypothetical protein
MPPLTSSELHLHNPEVRRQRGSELDGLDIPSQANRDRVHPDQAIFDEANVIHGSS